MLVELNSKGEQKMYLTADVTNIHPDGFFSSFFFFYCAVDMRSLHNSAHEMKKSC